MRTALLFSWSKRTVAAPIPPEMTIAAAMATAVPVRGLREQATTTARPTVAASAIASEPFPGEPSHCFDAEDAVEHRGMRLLVGGGVPGERHDGHERHDAGGEQRVNQPARPAACGVEPEADRHERQEVEEVPLLSLVECPEQAGLDEQAGGEENGERAERQLTARARPGDRKEEAEDRARDEDDAGSEQEHEQVRPRPLDERDRLDVDMEDAVVVREHAGGPEDDRRSRRDREENDRKQLLAKSGAQAAFAQARKEDRADEAGGQQDELDPRKGCEPREGDEGDLALARRALEGRDAGRERREDERIGERLGHHPGRVDEIRQGQSEGGGSERRPRPELQAAGYPVDRQSGQRHGERAEHLRDVVGDPDVADEPRWSGEHRLEQRREVRRTTADERPAALADRARNRRVEVLVAEVDGGRTHPGQRDPDREAQADETGEQAKRRDRRPLHRERGHAELRTGGSGRNRHWIPIGLGAALLESKKGAREPPSQTCTGEIRYGQFPVRMSAPGPDFFHVSAPTVDSMQYVVDEADWTVMFFTPAS